MLENIQATSHLPAREGLSKEPMVQKCRGTPLHTEGFRQRQNPKAMYLRPRGYLDGREICMTEVQ